MYDCVTGDFYAPMMNRTLGNAAQIRGAVATRRSIPLRYASRERTTMVTVIIKGDRSVNQVGTCQRDEGGGKRRMESQKE